MSALSVVLLFFGSVVWVFSYIVPILSGLINYIVKRAFGNKGALMSYIAVSILSIILLPDKECALMYALFFGYYPLIKYSIEKLKPSALRIILKLITFNISLAIIELLCVYVFNISFDDFLGRWGIVILLFSFNVMFLLYDRLFLIVSDIYDKKIAKYLK